MSLQNRQKGIIMAMLTIAIGLVTTSYAIPDHPLATTGTPGCGKSHTPGYHNISDPKIQSDGYPRYYGINIPSSYASDTTTPRKLIIDYHGRGGTPENQWNNSRYFAYPGGEAYIAVYPAGVNGSWQNASYAIPGVDDLQFTTDLLAHLREEYCIDNNHVYATGKSNGGGFVDFLACSSNGDEFAAFAMASAALYGDVSVGTCDAGGPRAILESHGWNDTTISYYGGTSIGGDLPDIQSWVGWWAQRDGCAKDCDGCELTEKKSGYEVLSYSCGGYQDIVQHYGVYELGHCWPSSSGNNSDSSRSYCWDRSLDYTPVVLDFLSRWSLSDFEKGWAGWRG